MKVNFGHSLKQKDRLRILLNVYGGAITTAQAQEHGIHRQTLSLLMQEGLITRIGHGIYCDSAGVEDELMALQARRQRIVYSHTTALYLHELTDRDPSVFDVTVRWIQLGGVERRGCACIPQKESGTSLG